MDILNWNGNNFGVFKLKELRKTQPGWIFIFITLRRIVVVQFNSDGLLNIVGDQYCQKLKKGQWTNHKMND